MKRNPALKSVPIKPKHVRSVPSKLLDFPLIAQKTTFTCGPAVVSAVTKYYKVRVSEGRARMMMDTCEKYGTKPEKMRDYLTYLGLQPRARVRTPLFAVKDAVKRGHPVIVLWNDWRGHFAVVIGFEGSHLILADPANPKSGMRVHKVKNFRKHWHAKVAGKSYRQLAIICKAKP
jgi:ABC-type bacteriocin/lantibiotic exporter with double-glycine peptidase domain